MCILMNNVQQVRVQVQKLYATAGQEKVFLLKNLYFIKSVAYKAIDNYKKRFIYNIYYYFQTKNSFSLSFIKSSRDFS